MEQINPQGPRRILHVLVAASFITGVVSCSSIPHLKVNYRLPPQTKDLSGNKVMLSFSDERGSKEILGKAASAKFRGFSGKILLSLSRGTEQGFMVGIYDLPSFITEVFKRKLENAGLEVLPSGEESDTEIQIALEDFVLDLIGGKWNFRMAYEARLIKGGKVLSKQMIRGRAERLKVIGTGDAHRMVGEGLTDLVNQMDVSRLFAQARM